MKFKSGLKAKYASTRTFDKDFCLHTLRYLDLPIVSKLLVGECIIASLSLSQAGAPLGRQDPIRKEFLVRNHTLQVVAVLGIAGIGAKIICGALFENFC